MSLLATTLCLTVVLAGCSGGSGGGDNAASNTTGTENEYKEKYDPPVTITTAWGIDPELKFKNGESMENNVATKWAKDQFGIEIKSLWSVTDTNGAFATKLRLAMSSGQEMPDIVNVGDNLLAQDLIDSGMYQEVGPLFDKYASDTWKKQLNKIQTYGTNIAVMAKEWVSLFWTTHTTMITCSGFARTGWTS